MPPSTGSPRFQNPDRGGQSWKVQKASNQLPWRLGNAVGNEAASIVLFPCIDFGFGSNCSQAGEYKAQKSVLDNLKAIHLFEAHQTLHERVSRNQLLPSESYFSI